MKLIKGAEYERNTDREICMLEDFDGETVWFKVWIEAKKRDGTKERFQRTRHLEDHDFKAQYKHARTTLVSLGIEEAEEA